MVRHGLIPPIDYVERWRRKVARRAEAMAASGCDSGSDRWAESADRFRPSVSSATTESDPFLRRIFAFVDHGTTVLDVGAGAGRHAVPLAKRAKQGVAVEPSPAMAAALQDEARRADISNIELVAATWETAEVALADVVICSNVLYFVMDIAPFLQKLATHTRRVCAIALRTGQFPWEEPEVYAAIGHRPPPPAPTFIDAYNVLHQLGLLADAEIVPLRWDRIFPASMRLRPGWCVCSGLSTTKQHALASLLEPVESGWRLRHTRSKTGIILWHREPSGTSSPPDRPPPAG